MAIGQGDKLERVERRGRGYMYWVCAFARVWKGVDLGKMGL